MRYFFTILLFITYTASLKAVPQDSVWVGGAIVDAISNDQIEDADLTFMKTDSTVVNTCRPINWNKKYGIDDADQVIITYSVPVPTVGNYIVRIESPLYETTYYNLSIPEKINGKRTTSFDVPDIPLNRKPKLLGEAEVRASKIMMINKGDTLIYNASAFQLNEGSMLDQLIAQLPGVRLTNEGQIFINEQYVSGLLIDGKDFFEGNPTIALRNLPAYTVDKVKTYHRGEKSDYLIQRDSTERLQDDLVIDVNLKREYHKSWLTNLEVGYGLRKHYQSRAFAMHLSDRSHFAAFGNVNNVGTNTNLGESFPTSIEELATTPSKEKNAGFDFRIEFGRKRLTYNTSLLASNHIQDVITETSSNSILGLQQTFNRSRMTNNNKRTNMHWRNLLCLPLPKMYAEFTLAGEYGRNKVQELYQNADFDRLPLEANRIAALDSVFNPTWHYSQLQNVISRLHQQTSSNTQRYAAVASAMTKWKSPFTNSPISFYTEASYEHIKGNANNLFDLQSKTGVTYLDEHNSTSVKNYSGKLRINYEYDLVKYLKLVAAYEFQGERNESNRLLDTLKSIPTPEVLSLLSRDLGNSYNRTQTIFGNQPEIQLRYTSPKWLMSFHFPVRFANVKFNEVRLTQATAHPHRTYAAFEPDVTITAAKGLTLLYSYKVQHPDLFYLTGFTDTADPINIIRGNINLKNVGKHLLQANYAKSNSKKIQNFGVGASFNLVHNEVTLQHGYNAFTGINTFSPINVNGNWNVQLDGSYSQAIDQQHRWIPEIAINYNIAQSVGYAAYNEEQYFTKSTMNSVTLNNLLGVKYQTSAVSVRLFVQHEWLHATSSNSLVSNANIRKMRYALSASVPLVWGINFSTDLSLYDLNGYESRALNKTTFVMNAALSRSFLRNKSLTIQLLGFDIFKGLNNMEQKVNANGRIETWHNSLHRYAMLKVMYRFNNKKKDKKL